MSSKPTKKRSKTTASPPSAVDERDAARYQVLDQREHLLKRPDMVLGSTERAEHKLVRVYDGNAMRYEDTVYSAALIQVVQEVLSNAADRPARGDTTTLIEVEIPPLSASTVDDADALPIVIRNNGQGIPIVEKTLQDGDVCLVPELCFGRFMAGENFDDDETRWNVGRNGIGATACNVYSQRFEVRVRDPLRKKQFEQRFRDNMAEKTAPRVTACSAKNGLVEVRLWPDYVRFGYADGRLDDATRRLLMTRVVDMAACVGAAGVKVKLNGALLPVRSMQHLGDLVFGADRKAVPRFYHRQFDTSNDRVVVRIEFVMAHADPAVGARHVGFVNGVPCDAGKHVQYVLDRVADVTIKHFKDKRASNKDQVDASESLGGTDTFCDYKALRPVMLKNNMSLLVSVTVDNPSFKSQSKEELATPMSKWGFRVELPDNLPVQVQRLGIVRSAMVEAATAQQKALSRVLASGAARAASGRGRRPDVPKLDDAHDAGIPGAHNVLVLIEGDSAKEMTIAGITSLPDGKRNFGAFPFKGKVLNVRQASVDAIKRNVEVQNLCRILGAAPGSPNVSSAQDLRYQQLFLLTDSDVDGAHIAGLIVNAIQSLWPAVARDPNFFVRFRTPIRMAKLRAKRAGLMDDIFFLTESDYDTWFETGAIPPVNLVDNYDDEDASSWSNTIAPVFDGLRDSAERLKRYSISYLKGLGSSSNKMAIRYFRYMRRFVVKVDCSSAEDQDALKMAFSKKREEERKNLVDTFDSTVHVDYDADRVTFRDFCAGELSGAAHAACARAIPALSDGLKSVHRKVLYAMMTSNRPFAEEKVSILVGDIMKRTAYHHGEQSIIEAIVHMAQCHVGTNNINLLYPQGQFGSRLASRKTHSAPRYIFTHLERVAEALFPRVDFPCYLRADDDGRPIEFSRFAPILPMILVNGAHGIGTGYSTDIPPYHPVTTVAALTRNEVRAYCAFLEQIDTSQFTLGPRGTLTPEIEQRWLSRSHDNTDEPVPWFDLFRGSVTRVANSNPPQFIVRGTFERLADGIRVRVTELPIDQWKDVWKESIMKKNRYSPSGGSGTGKRRRTDSDASESESTSAAKSKAQGFVVEIERDNSTHIDVDIVLKCDRAQLALLDDNALYKALLLESKITTSNMHLWDRHDKVRRYSSVHDIVREFVILRHYQYELRKNYTLAKLKYEHRVLVNKHRFLQAFVENRLELRNRSAADIVAQCEREQIERVAKPFCWLHPDATGGTNHDNHDDDDDQTNFDGKRQQEDDDNGKEEGDEGYDGYDYLLRQNLSTLTQINLERFAQRIQAIDDQLTAVEAVTVRDMWERDLDKFEQEYIRFLQRKDECLQRNVSAANGQRGNKRRGRAKKKQTKK